MVTTFGKWLSTNLSCLSYSKPYRRFCDQQTGKSSSQNTKKKMGNCLSKVWKSFDLEYQEQISDILSLVSRFEKKFLYGAQYNKLHSIKAYKPSSMVLDVVLLKFFQSQKLLAQDFSVVLLHLEAYPYYAHKSGFLHSLCIVDVIFEYAHKSTLFLHTLLDLQSFHSLVYLILPCLTNLASSTVFA